MRENCTYGLSGGRWPAPKCATSDPTPEKLPNNADSHAAEVAEGRGRAKGNPPKHDKRWTASQGSLPIGLERVRLALPVDLQQEPNMGNLYVRIRAGGAE